MNRLPHVLLNIDSLFRVRLAQLLEVVKVAPDQLRAASTLPHNLTLDERFSHYAFKLDRVSHIWQVFSLFLLNHLRLGRPQIFQPFLITDIIFLLCVYRFKFDICVPLCLLHHWIKVLKGLIQLLNVESVIIPCFDGVANL